MQSEDYSHVRHQFSSRKRWLIGSRERTVYLISRSRAVCGSGLAMTIRSRRETITFQHPFRIKGIDRSLPAGDYGVITDEEMIEGLSFAAYRRIATMIVVPAAPPRSSTMEMISISSVDSSDAQRIDACTSHE
jgi:hypothetical protein